MYNYLNIIFLNPFKYCISINYIIVITTKFFFLFSLRIVFPKLPDDPVKPIIFIYLKPLPIFISNLSVIKVIL